MPRATTAGPGLRVCVVTSVPGDREPRAPRHAAWIAGSDRTRETVFVDMAPPGTTRGPVRVLAEPKTLEWRTHRYPTLARQPLHGVAHRVYQQLGRLAFRLSGHVVPAALAMRATGLERLLDDVRADVYLAHNIETLLPAWRVAQRRGALLMFDAMEFHSDMGDGQAQLERELVRAIETICLDDCALVLASSDQVADALAEAYGIRRPVALYNVPPREAQLPTRAGEGLHLYWRNAVVDLSQRGLDDALVALRSLPQGVTLHLQGRPAADGGAGVQARMAELGVASRVHLHPPHAPEDAVRAAARHHIGLCLERRGCRNHELTVSNKIFDYHMAGLAVVASDLPGLRAVLQRSRGGLLYEPGSVDDLIRTIGRLHADRSLLSTLAGRAREHALREANRDVVRERFLVAFAEACDRRPAAGTRDRAAIRQAVRHPAVATGGRLPLASGRLHAGQLMGASL